MNARAINNGHALSLRGVSKRYGDFAAAADVSLHVDSGAFLTLLGPSGSGKTTLLNVIAGFAAPDAGAVLLDGRDITRTPPEKRDFGMVFQGYALFPHLSVAENVAFPLRVRRMGKAEIRERVLGALDLVQLSGFGDRLPSQLSGGQQQRVALARALVFAPKLLLLDEPLSALDKKLRAELQEELRSLHRRVGLTFIAVTHDQEEALSMSDSIAILRDGRLVQEGAPALLYERPRSRFVADFLGKSNFIRGQVKELHPEAFGYTVGGLRLRQLAARGAPRPALGAPVLIALRPEKIDLLAPGEVAENVVEGQLVRWSYLGAALDLIVRTAALGEIRATVRTWGTRLDMGEGQTVRLGWAAAASVPVQED